MATCRFPVQIGCCRFVAHDSVADHLSTSAPRVCGESLETDSHATVLMWGGRGRRTLTPVGSGVAQVFHDLLVELRLLLVAEVEEGEEEDRQEEG